MQRNIKLPSKKKKERKRMTESEKKKYKVTERDGWREKDSVKYIKDQQGEKNFEKKGKGKTKNQISTDGSERSQ